MTNRTKSAEDRKRRVLERADVVRRIRNEIRNREPLPEYLLTRAPILERLRSTGCEVRTLEDLKYNIEKWKAAVPILINWLEQSASATPEDVKEEVVRLLAVPFAQNAASVLLREFRIGANCSYKWAIANTLAVLTKPEFGSEYLELARDRNHGTARQMIVYALPKLKHPDAINVVIECLQDPNVVVHAIHAAKMLKNPLAIPHLESLLQSESASVRRKARSAIERIGTAGN